MPGLRVKLACTGWLVGCVAYSTYSYTRTLDLFGVINLPRQANQGYGTKIIRKNLGFTAIILYLNYVG